MNRQWIIQVEGKDYGPVDFETLVEWKVEGRVIPQNRVRPADDEAWITAAEIPDLFAPEATTSAHPPPLPETLPSSQHSFGRIIIDTFRVYRRSLLQFTGLALFAVLPSICAQLASAWIQNTPGATFDVRSLVAGAFAFFMLVVSIVVWPIYVAGIQILAANTLTGLGTPERLGGRPIGFFSTLNEAVRFWPRIAALCALVYGVFFLLMLFALAIAVLIVTGGTSIFVIFLALGLLVVQVWMFGRFFINVLFWQQFAVLENCGVLESLRESKNLARGRENRPWYQRPWWRGAAIVSIWIAFVLLITVVADWPNLRQEWDAVLTVRDPQLLVQRITALEQARGFNGLGFALAILQKLLQPLLGIAFVVLYFASTSRRA